ncbi:MAG: sigma-70 family RNA polymerase sigma factor [Siphonobacter aquaeclarae]|nr:sigma-70 family RNA polymerase sigma factor [Siphonobacter aquaeclarae]
MKTDWHTSDDIQLWNQFRKGDADAFAGLYQRYVGVLYNYGYHFLADAAEVEDAIQELFIDLWRLRENLSETTSVKFYLFRSLRRRIRQVSEGRSLTVQIPDSPSSDHAIPSYEADYIFQEQHTLDLHRLREVLLQLPARQHEAIRLRFFDDFSWEQVALIMQMNEQSVRNLIQRALRKLKELFGLLAAFLPLLVYPGLS